MFSPFRLHASCAGVPVVGIGTGGAVVPDGEAASVRRFGAFRELDRVPPALFVQRRIRSKVAADAAAEQRDDFAQLSNFVVTVGLQPEKITARVKF
jgi:hypothetical protein